MSKKIKITRYYSIAISVLFDYNEFMITTGWGMCLCHNNFKKLLKL